MSVYFPTSDELAHHTIFPGVNIETCAGERLMLSLVELAPHSVVEEHFHPHEQAGMILQGRLLFFIGAEQKTLEAGDRYFVPGNVRHKVVTLDEPARVLDVFTPVREEYR